MNVRFSFSLILVTSLLFVSAHVYAQKVPIQRTDSITYEKLKELRDKIEELEAKLAETLDDYQEKIATNEISITMSTELINDISSTLNPPIEEILWEEMPVGSSCGVYMMTGGSVSGRQVDCQGHNPNVSCPTGFVRADLGYFEAGNGGRKFVICMKETATENEKDWDKLPSGSLCGVYMKTQGSTKANISCQGHNPNVSCPTDYTRVSKGYFEAGGGDRQLQMCAKD